MHNRYEVLILASPEITQTETANLEKEFGKVIQGTKGSIISFERWGKYRLSFPVRKKDYGVYFLARVEVPKGAPIVGDVRTLFIIKMNSIVARHVVISLDPKGSLEYQRPKSLEESPSTRDVTSFLKGNKMEGLLPASGAAPAAPAASATPAKEAVEGAEERTKELAGESAVDSEKSDA